MNDNVTFQEPRAAIPRGKRALRASAIVMSIATAVTGCGGGGSGSGGAVSPALAANAVDTAVNNSATQAGSANHEVVPRNARFEGKNLEQWEVSYWQWVNGQDNGPFWSNPLISCTNRPISIGQSGNVWYFTAPNTLPELLPTQQTCDQSANVIPAGTAIFLATLETFSSTLLPPGPFTPTTAAGEQALATGFADEIQDLFVTIDNVPVTDVQAYRVATDPFTFTAPLRWAFGQPERIYGSGTAVADGYYLILKPLPPGPHTIHYGGRFDLRPGDFGPGSLATDDIIGVTLLITVGPE